MPHPRIGAAPDQRAECRSLSRLADDVSGRIAALTDAGADVLLVDDDIRKVIEVTIDLFVRAPGSVQAEDESYTARTDLHAQLREWLRPKG